MTDAGPRHLRFADGRGLDVYESGAPDGRLLLVHHGTPGSGVPVRSLSTAAHGLGLRVVSISRPGYGASTRCAGRRVVDVAADCAAVLDALRVEQCFVAGWSGGGPHALACAARLAGRVAGALVIAGVAPYQAAGLDFLSGMGEDNVTEFGKAVQGEAELRPFVESLGAEIRQSTGADLVQALSSLLPEVDRAVLTSDLGDQFAANMHEGLRRGVDGWIDDDLAFVRPWGFALAEVAVPTMLWQGSADLMVPFAHGQWLAGQIPGVVAHLMEGEGHLSLRVGAIDRMLRELVAAG